jgi:cell division protein FtsW
LLVLGVGMVFSASYVPSMDRFGDSTFLFRKQFLACFIGLGVATLAALLRREVFQKLAIPLVLVTIVGLVLVLIPGIGVVRNGARRWIVLGPLTFQPAEIAKVALILYLSRFVAKREGSLASFSKGILAPVMVGGVLIVLVMKEPDLGSAALLGVLLMAMLFVGGGRLLHLGALAAVALVGLVYEVLSHQYRWRRMSAFLKPWHDPKGAGFQIIQSFLAFASGGLWGRGSGAGSQKLLYLPEAHSDFIFSVVAEELGLVGSLLVLGLFSALVYRGFALAIRSKDLFDTMLVFGVTCALGFQSFLNLAVAMGLVPTKGLPLPLMSYGGSSLIVSLLMVGMLINRARERS